MRRKQTRGVRSPPGIAPMSCTYELRPPIFSWGYAVRRQQSPTQRDAIKSEVKGRKTSHVKSEQPAKHFGVLAKSLESPLLKLGPTVEREHQSRHPQRTPGKPPVCQLILREFAG